MATWQPDPSFYPSPRQAAKAPAEKLAYVAGFDPARKTGDTIATVDVDPASPTYSQILGTVQMPKDSSQAAITTAALANADVQKAMGGKPQKRVIVVPNRLVNVVV